MKKKISDIWKFITYDIWRITEGEVTRTKFSLYNIIKTIYLSINRFTKDRMANKAAALTYSTLLAIVPILAILFAIARGFGVDSLLESQFRTGFGGHTETTEAILSFLCRLIPVADQGRRIYRSRPDHVAVDSHQPCQQHRDYVQPHLGSEKGPFDVPQNNRLLFHAPADAHPDRNIRRSIHLCEHHAQANR